MLNKKNHILKEPEIFLDSMTQSDELILKASPKGTIQVVL